MEEFQRGKRKKVEGHWKVCLRGHYRVKRNAHLDVEWFGTPHIYEAQDVHDIPYIGRNGILRQSGRLFIHSERVYIGSEG